MCTVEYDTSRYELWKYLIPNYESKSSSAKKEAKRAYARQHNKQPYQITWELIQGYTPVFNLGYIPEGTIITQDHIDGYWTKPVEVSFDTLYNKAKRDYLDNLVNPPVVVSDYSRSGRTPENLGVKEEKEQKETTMYVDYEDLGPEQNYLLERLSGIYEKVQQEAYTFFGLRDDPYPNNAKEMVERLQQGKFTWDTKEPEKKSVYNFYSYISFRDPDRVKNMEGYNAWEKLFQEQYTKTKDIIMIKSQDEGLEAVYELEKFPIE